MPPKAPDMTGIFSRMSQLFSESGKKLPSMQLSSVLSFYPRAIGNGLANGMCGHNAFIKDVPKDFSEQYAKHFVMLEAMSMMPAASLIFVHYFSSMLRFRDRQNLIAPLQNEVNQKVRAVHFWLAHIEKKNPSSAPFWRVGLLAMQVATFPLWLFFAATAPPVFHCALEEGNHILCSKYNCILKKSPPFVQQRSQQCDEACEFHKQHALIKTDVAALMLCLFIIWWLLF